MADDMAGLLARLEVERRRPVPPPRATACDDGPTARWQAARSWEAAVAETDRVNAEKRRQALIAADWHLRLQDRRVAERARREAVVRLEAVGVDPLAREHLADLADVAAAGDET